MPTSPNSETIVPSGIAANPDLSASVGEGPSPPREPPEPLPIPAASRGWWRKNWIEISAVLAGLAVMHLTLFARAFQGPSLDAQNAGQLGDFIGGYIGTAFLLLNVVLLVHTLRTQGEAFRLQQFEARFFDMLKLHRDNVVEMKVQSVEGRRVFIMMFYELRAIAGVVEEISRRLQVQLGWRDSLRISYYCLFFGAGANSSRMVKSELADMDQRLIDEIDQVLQDQGFRDQVRADYAMGYEPFEGHQSRLGHYFRHLYQSVQYAHSKRFLYDSYGYVKTLRAQLSTHEQAMLLVNSLTPVGERWWSDGLIENYKMVKNVHPKFLERFQGHELTSELPEGYFEWQRPSDK